MLVGLSPRLRDLRCCVPILLIALLLLPCALAQETTAGLQGSVKDASGGVVPNASVEVASPAMIGTRKVNTDDAGNFRLAALTPGTYTMTVAARGFRTFRQTGIELSVGRLPNFDVKLDIGGVTETVEVSSLAAPWIRRRASAGHRRNRCWTTCEGAARSVPDSLRSQRAEPLQEKRISDRRQRFRRMCTPRWRQHHEYANGGLGKLRWTSFRKCRSKSTV
jgi:hypothetical protein